MTRITIAFLGLLLVLTGSAQAQKDQYDICYIWEDNLENVLDYEEKLTEVLGPGDGDRLRIVGRPGGQYGIIYDLDGTALESAQLMIKHGEVLRRAGMPECTAVEDSGYFRLYNVSYGLGPNLEALKKLYSRIYNYLGEEVGKNLYIERTDGRNYTLIYRRRGDRKSTYAVARKHASLLRKLNIQTTIIPENNNPVLFGESSHLDDAGAEVAAAPSGPDASATKPEILEQAPPPEPVELQPAVARKIPVGPVSRVKPVEADIEAFIKSLRAKGQLSRDEMTGWVVFDLTTGESVVDINADQLFQAASMIKPFIALAFFHRVKGGELIYGPKSRAKMERMIQRSDNAATNWVLRMVGGPARCQEILLDHYRHLFKNTQIVEYIPAGGKTYRNRALPSDYVRFLQALWRDELPYGREIRRLMSLPGRDRLYDGTPIPRGTLVYNKTGSTAHLCGDMGILVPRDRNGRRYPYAVVGIIERSSRPKNYGDWMLTRGNVIRKVSTMVYQEMKRQYQLL